MPILVKQDTIYANMKVLNKIIKIASGSQLKTLLKVAVVVIIGVCGVVLLRDSRAAAPVVSVEPESSTVTSPATKITGDTSASGAGYVMFKPSLASATVNIMPLGDSITAGDSAGPAVIKGYRQALSSLLAGYDIRFVGSQFDGTYNHESAGGSCIGPTPASPADWGTACWSRNMYVGTSGWISIYRPSIVIMQGGSNDFCCGGHDTYPNNEQIISESFKEWINLVFVTKPDVYVIVIGALDYHPVFKANIENFVAAEAAKGRHIYYVSYDGVTTVDTVHPDVQGYQTLANRIAPIVTSILQ